MDTRASVSDPGSPIPGAARGAPRRARPRRLAGVLLALAAIGVVAWLLWCRPRPLIDRAIDIGIAPAWQFSAVSASAVQGTRDGAIVGIRDLDLVRYDPRTGSASKLPGVTSRMARRTQCIALSPDGRWVLWVVQGEVHVTALDGSSDRVWRTGGLQLSQVGWQADTGGWFAVAGAPAARSAVAPSPQLLVCKGTTPRALRSIPVSMVGGGHTLAGALRDGRILLCSDPSRAKGGADLVVVDPSAPPAHAVLPYACRPPETVGRGQVTVAIASPHGDRLLWGVEVPGSPLRPADWLRRLLGRPPAGDGGLMRLYSTGVDGSRPVLILEARQDEEGLAPYGWASDGRHLLIARHGRVLLVPTE